MYHTLDPTAAKRQEYFAAKLEEWSNAYEQWQERAKALGVDKEHDEETREELMQRRDADGVAGADIRLDTKRAHDDTTNSESAPPAKNAKGPPTTPPEEEVKDPTLQQIFESFHAHDRNKGRNLEWLEALESNCQNYGWNGSDKSYVMSEYNQERFGSSFLKLHGAERLCDNIDHFLSYFVPRKMMTPDDDARLQGHEALRGDAQGPRQVLYIARVPGERRHLCQVHTRVHLSLRQL